MTNKNQIHEILEQILSGRRKQRIQEQLNFILEDIGPSVPGQDMNTNIGGAPSFGIAPAQLTMGSLSSYKIPTDLKDKLFTMIQTTPLKDTMAKIDMVANFIQQLEMQQQMEAEMMNDAGDGQGEEMDQSEEQMEGEVPPEDSEEIPQEDEEGDIDSEEQIPSKGKKAK